MRCAAEKPVAKPDDSKTPDAKASDKTPDTVADTSAPKARKPKVLAESATHRVLADDKRVWKEAK